MTEVRVDLPYLYEDPDRHGTLRRYVRRFGRKIRLRAEPGTTAFATEYAAALESATGGSGPVRVSGPQPESLGWLAREYFASPEFQKLDAKSQTTRRGIIEACLREPLKRDSKLVMRDCPYKLVDATHIGMLVDRKSDRPGAANNRRKYLSSMFGWAIKKRRFALGRNPVRDVEALDYASDGFHTWTLEEVRAYEAQHPIGSKARLAFALLHYLGARRGDMIRLGPKNRRDGVMTYVPRKTRYRRLEPSIKPILAPLVAVLAATPLGLKTFLVTDKGEPFTDAGIGNKMREWCDQAGLPGCTAHGLKKIAAVLCAEAGATDRQMMALFDWSSEKVANKYTAAARKAVLAAEAGRLLGGSITNEAATRIVAQPVDPPDRSVTHRKK